MGSISKKKTVVAALLVVIAVSAVAGCGGSSSTGASGEIYGVPVYPGATKVNPSSLREFPQGGSMPGPGDSRPNRYPDGSMPGSMPRGSMPGQRTGAFNVLAAYWTPDSYNKVSAWYKNKLSGRPGYHESTPQAGGRLGSRAVYTFQSGDTNRTVMVREYTQPGGGTTITVRNVPQGMTSGPQIR